MRRLIILLLPIVISSQLFAVAGFASKAKNILSNRNYKILIIGLSLMLIYFGVEFLLQI